MANGTPTTNMGLTKWAAADTFDYVQLANNFETIDAHNHTGNGKGLQIPVGGIASSAVGNTEIANLAIDASKIQDGVITASKFTADALFKSVVTTLPTTTSWTASNTGYEIYYQNSSMASTGAIWHLRYRYGVTYPWEFLGGSSFSNVNYTDSNDTSDYSTYNKVTTSAKLTIPLAGDYEVYSFTEGLVSNANDLIWANVSVNGSTPVEARRYFVSPITTAVSATSSITSTFTGLNASEYIENWYKRRIATSGAQSTISANGLYIKPIRVG